MLLVPENKMRILDPKNRNPIPESGIEVDSSSPHYHYWLRRLKCGDVRKVEPTPPENKAAKAKPTE